MKAVVFGGSGFLGSHVADALTEAGHDVTVFDLRDSPYLCEGQRMVVGDIMDQAAVEKTTEGCDVAYNFAGIADIDEASLRPLDTVKYNILGNTIILEACRLRGVKRFVFAGTVYVYSDSGSFYRNSKQACELITESYHEVYGLDYTILRYGSLYGPRADDRNWIHKILKEAVTEGKIVREGDGEEIREYVHVQDAARCSVEILTEEYKNQYVVITGHHPMKVKDLLEMIREMLGGRVEIEYVPSQSTSHYNITPYSFNPRIGKKLVSHYYLDTGQGILNCLSEIYEACSPHASALGVITETQGKD